MGRPLTQEDLNAIEESFKNMEHLSTRQKIVVFLPGIIVTGLMLYQYYYIITHLGV